MSFHDVRQCSAQESRPPYPTSFARGGPFPHFVGDKVG